MAINTTATARVQKDLKEVNSIVHFDTPPIYCKPKEDSLERVEALIIGPPETPYSFGYFLFDLKFCSTYPDKPPKVHILTTDDGKCRLNPNLYAGGKVCLSILGTWSGESEDEWRSSYSINYVLRAIQSLIMTPKPYHNEPGYEEMNPQYGKPEEVEMYTAKIKHEVLRVAVCNVLEDCVSHKPENTFAELIKNNFLYWFDTYIKLAKQDIFRDGSEFQAMPFEYPENGACGKFNYALILDRLNEIRTRLDKETLIWKERGKELTKAESGWKYFKLLEEHEKIKKGSVKLEGISAGPISDDNLYYWTASIIGPEGTLWEGGIYNLELVFNDSDAPPRVRFLCEMWHPHITKDGVPFYPTTASSREPVIPTLLAIYKILKSEPNSSSATWVNPEAAVQYFSKKDEDKRAYKKKVTQCARKSIEM